MRIILKIIAAPFVLALILAVAVLSFLSCIAGALCWLACTVFVLLAACGFFAGKIYNLNENNISSSDVKKIVIDNVKVSKELGVYVKSSGMLNEKAAVENCFEY